MLKYPGMLTWPDLGVHPCLLCEVDISSAPLCPSCQERMEREVVEFLEKDMPSSNILSLHKIMQVVLLEEGNN